MGIKDIRILLRDKLKTPKHCIIVSSHNLTEIAAIADILIFIRNGQIIEMIENKYDEKELEVLYENLMTSITTEEVQ